MLGLSNTPISQLISIQFISCSVDPKGVLTHRIWNMSIHINIQVVNIRQEMSYNNKV